MGKYLDALVENAMSSRRDELTQGESGESADLFYEATKKGVIAAVLEEVKAEVKAEVLAEAQSELEKISLRAKLKDYEELAISGIFIASFVGLFINQITELIGYLKGTISSGNWIITLVWALVFLVLIIVVCMFLFGREVLKLIKKK